MVDIHNDAELANELNKIAQKVIEAVSDKILDRLRDYIDRDVYKSHGPNQVYHDGSRNPTGEFRKAWEWTSTTQSAINQFTKELFYNYSTMRFDGDTWLHGSNVVGKNGYQWGDATEYLAEILNGDVKLSSLWITRPRRDYWTNLIRELFQSGVLTQWFDAEMGKYGFVRF